MKKVLSVVFILAFAIIGNAQTVIYFNPFTSATFPATGGITGAATDDVLVQSGAGNQWVRNINYANSSGAEMTYPWNGSNAANCWYITGNLNLNTSTTYLVTLYYRVFSFPEAFTITYGQGQTAAAQTNVLASFSIPGTNNNFYHVATATFTPSTNGVYNIGIHGTSPANQNLLAIDDIRVVALPTSCGSAAYTASGPLSQTYSVPAGCTKVNVTTVGGSGGSQSFNNASTTSVGASLGGLVSATVDITGQTSLNVYVGGAGIDCGGYTFGPGVGGGGIGTGGNGGQSTSGGGSGGGGSSEIRGSDGTTVYVVAGGGGGAAGATFAGGNAGPSGSATAGGGGARGGGPGTNAAGGALGTGTTTNGSAAVTTDHNGGNGGNGGAFGGGGGGAGYYGGGGGGGGSAAGSGAGGGGANYAAPSGITSITNTTATTYGPGYVSITPVAPTAFAMNGGGVSCSGSAVTVGLAGTSNAVIYELYRDAVATGVTITGNGSAMNFPAQTIAATYTAKAYYFGFSGCKTDMSGSAIVTAVTNPTVTTADPLAICSGSSTAIGLTASVPSSFTWTVGTITGGITGATPCAAACGTTISQSLTNPSGTNAGSVVYLVTPTSTLGSCLGTTAAITQTVNPVPDVSTFSTSSSDICKGNSATVTITSSTLINGGAYSVNYTLSGAGGNTGTFNAPMNFGTGSGTFQIAAANLPNAGATTVTINSVTFISVGCPKTLTTGNTANFNVNALPVPVFDIQPSANTCVGSVVVYTTQSGKSGYTWSIPGLAESDYHITAGGTSTNSVSLQWLTFGSKTVTVNYTDGNGCLAAAPASNTVNVGSAPIAHNVTGGGSYCSGAGVPVGLDGSDLGIRYQLYVGVTPVVGAFVDGTGGAISFGAQPGPGNMTVVATNTLTTCTNNMTGFVTVNVTAPPSIFNVTGGGTYCAGGNGVSVGLSGSNNLVSYQLYRGVTAVGSPVVGNGSAINFGPQTATGTQLFSVKANPGTSCETTMSLTATVTANPLPAVISGTQTLCVTTTTTLSNSEAGTWSTANTTLATVDATTGVVSGVSTGTALITFTLASTGCTRTASVTVSPFAAPITGSTTLCVGGTTTLSDTNPGTWTSSNTNQVTVNPSTGLVTAIGIGNSAVTFTSGPGCAATTTVTVNALPALTGVAPSSTALCTGAQLILTANGATGAGSLTSYNWAGPNSYFGSTTINTNTITPSSTLASGSYSVTVTYAGVGCTSLPQSTAVVAVSNAPSLTGASNSGPICVGDQLVVNANGAANVTAYAWAGPVSFTGGASTASATITPTTGAAAGNYTVTVSNAGGTGCIARYTTTGVVNALPATPTVSGGGGPFCGSTTLTASNGGSGTIYFQGTNATGTSIATPAVLQVVSSTGTYHFRALSAGGCWSAPGAGASVNVNTLPTAFAITGGGSYCSGGTGVNICLAGSEGPNVSYQLYEGAFISGAPVTGNNGVICFGSRTNPGNYTVVATNTGSNCTSNMTGSTTIAVTPIPTAYNVIGGGAYCNGGTGVSVGLNGSDAGVSYQLYNNGVAVGSMVPGTGAAITFGTQTSAGSYSVVANPSATCATPMSNGVTVTITTPPTAFTVSGSGSYCPGSAGLHVLLSGSQTSTNYQLYKDGVSSGSAFAGTNGALDFGLQTAGTYAIVATSTATSCTNTMTGTAVITTSALPAVFATTGGGGYCSGGTGVVIGMANSTTGVNYTLYNSSGAASAPVGGSTGNPITFGPQTAAGTYTVVASDAITFCTSIMTGNPVVTITATPQLHNVVGGGNQCSGGLGFDLGVDGSEAGVSYQLYRNGVATGLPVTGTGAAVDLGLQTLAGTYTVKANPGTNCETTMTGSTVINIVALPNAFTVTGGGTYCTGGSGFHIGVNGSESNVNYQLYKDGIAVGVAVAGGSGAIDFGTLMSAGTYKVIGTSTVTGCSRTMTDSAVIIFYPTALTHTVTGGGQYCEDGAGVNIGLNGSEVGVTYQLYREGLPVGSLLTGTGLAISFGNQTVAGQYAVVANPASTCAATMTNSVTVTINPKPTQYNVTGTGSYCAGGTGLAVGLSGSNTGISYQLYRNGSLLGSAQAGSSSALGFGLQTAAGTYTVLATNNTTGCQNAMAGQATITVNAAPAVYSVTGGGGYCNGGTGVHVGLSSSTAGIKYQLYNGVIPQGIALTGTGSALDFGLITLGGTYTVIAQDPVTLCTSNMSGATSVVVNSLPTAYTASGTGSLCSGGTGVHITLSNSTTGVNYQLYNNTGAVGTSVAGINGALDFGAITTGGTYTIVATNATTGCQNNMTGNPVITVNPLPVVQSVNGGGAYCQGGAGVFVGLANSQSGVTYNLWRGATLAASVVSTGGAFNFIAQTVAGTYSVVATTGLGCSAVMSGVAIVTMNALPTAYTVSGTGAYCSGGAGLNVTLSSSATGVNYQLYNGAAPISTPMPGTGAALNFGPQTVAGTYTVQATNATTGCTNIMAGSAVITVNTTPALATVTGGGAYCSGGTGVHIGLTNPTTSGISYQLVNGSGPVGAPIVSTGGAIDFNLITGAGIYSVIATNTVTGCSATMSGNAIVTVNTLPQIYNVSGGGVYCAGGTGFSITTSGSNLGINYQLMLGGSPVGGAMAGTGSGLNFGTQTAPGAYTVVATNGSTGCTANMSGTATISVNTAPTTFAMTGGGSYCSGGAGVALGLGSSTLGVSYQLYNGSTLVTTVAGTNNAISFGSLTAAGTYTVTAVNSITGCQSPMSGFKTITIDQLPLVYTVSGTGSYCQGGAGVTVVMNNSESTVNYQLYRGATMVGSPVQGLNGPLSFGPQMTGGVYTVVASNITTGCTSNMTGSATVTVNPLPAIYSVTGGGNYCQGGTGVNVGLNASNTGINYKLYNGATLVDNRNGNGSGFNFGLQTAVGTYTVLATNNSTGCSAVMSGMATVGTNALPGAQVVTGGGNYCSNDAGVVISLVNSVSGINYQLYRGSTPVGLPVAGVNGPLPFPLQTVAGTYSVTASDATTGCTMGMTGSATVGINLAPALFTVTGGGNYCQGGAGMPVGLSSSATGVEYELYFNGSATGIIVNGDGNPITFGPQTTAGTYSVNARNTSTNCTIGMSGVAVVGINNLPDVYTILGAASSYCAGGAGIDMILINSQVGVNYQLINGSVAIGFAQPGTGTTLDFGNQTVAGTYIVQATNATTGCSAYMASSASVVISPLPTIYTVSGGGGYCAGTAGAPVGLSSSNLGITYKLYRGATLVDSKSGTGAALDFGPQTAGAYTVVASNNLTTCSSNMAGGANVSLNTLPDVYNVTGGGNYCTGGAGVPVGLANSQTGINYQLYNGTSAVGFPMPGTTGSPIAFGPQTSTGAYTVMGIDASTNCGVSMTGTVTVGTNVTPDVFTVTGGGHFCNGGAGVTVGLSNSVAGIRYQLFNGATLVSTMMGTGSSLNFGAQMVPGSYAAVATNTVTGCSANMSGTPAVVTDPLPTVFVVGGGGSYCAGGSGVAITLSSSQTGINYQLYNGSSTVDLPVAGTGAALSLGTQAAVGTYSVMAINATTGCMMGMAGSATVSITNVVIPAVIISSGMGDSVCAGVPTSFTAMTVNGGTSPTYSWTVNGSATGISGATLTYMPTNGDVVAVTMTSSAACATPATVNDAMVVSVLPLGAPSVNVTADPGNQVCDGTTVTFMAAPTLGGTAPAYYWVRNSAVVGTGSTFSYAPNDNDVVYCMMVSNYTCRTIDTVFSNTTRMEVDPPVVPTITITADPGAAVHPNVEVTLTAVVSNAGSSPTFQWYIGSSAIPGATGATLTSSNFSTGDSITCVVTSSSACKLSAFNSIVMTVFPVGVDQVSLGNSDIKLMPNPSKGWFTVKGTLGVATDEEVTLEVTNMLGQTVYNNKIVARNGSIDERIELGSNLANGMYMLSLKTQSGNKVFHIVVEQ